MFDAYATPTWLRRLFCFGVTGVLATAIHIAIATLLIIRFTVAPYVAIPIAFVIATCFAYTSNTLWSFASQMSHRTLQRHVGVSAIGCLATAAVSAAADVAHLDTELASRWQS